MKQEHIDAAAAISVKLKAIRDEANALEEKILADWKEDQDEIVTVISDACVLLSEACECFAEFEPQPEPSGELSCLHKGCTDTATNASNYCNTHRPY